MRSLSPDVVEYLLQWLDLASHLRLREASPFDRDETPRRTTTLQARDCEQARRCQEKIFTPDKNTRLHSITLDIAAPNSSRCSHRGSSNSSMPPPTHHLSSYDSTLSSFLEEASCAARRAALSLLVRDHRPAELRFKNMVRGGEFSDALLSLEKNLDQVRRDVCVLHLGLATGGPRPYQDPRSHYWCMLRLRRILGTATNSGGASARGGEDAVMMDLADLTKELLGDATAAATMPHLIGRDGRTEEEEVAENGVRAGDRSAQSPAAFVAQGRSTGGLKAYWPRLSELTLSCGIVGGDLERLSGCLESFPNLQLLDLRGHAFRPPTTSLSAFARGLQASASSASPRTPAFRPGRLTTLSLKNFKVEGVTGVTALGQALSAERFPRLAALSIDSCRLVDEQFCALTATLPGMSRTLTSLSFRSNYALSAEGVKALAKVLRTGSGSHPGCCGGGFCCSTFAWEAENCLPPSRPRNCCRRRCCGPDDGAVHSGAMTATTAMTMMTATSVGETLAESTTAIASAAACSKDGSAGAPATSICTTATKSLPERAPAWSVPSPTPPPPPPPPPRPASSLSLACSCQRRPTPAAPAAADSDDDVANAPPLMLESLDLSYSCWWSRPTRTARTGREEGSGGGPFASLLKVLREGGACPTLRSLRLEGCYLGDTAVGQLIAALESKSGSCRTLRVLNINGNLFGEVGVRLFADAFLGGKMPPHLRMVVFCTNAKPSYRKLHASMSLEDMNETIGLWMEHQKGVHASLS